MKNEGSSDRSRELLPPTPSGVGIEGNEGRVSGGTWYGRIERRKRRNLGNVIDIGDGLKRVLVV